MNWKKLGLVYGPDGSMPWAKTHAMVPTPYRMADRIRVFVTFCDDSGVGRPGYVDVSPSDPTKVIGASKQPLLDVGIPGTFDDNGMVACSVAPVGQRLFMYYAGFELGVKVRYRIFTGLAISEDGGESFHRHSTAPILDRSDDELYFRGGPFCMKSADRFRLWYVAGSEWVNLEGKQMPVYDLRYAESLDGITWPSKGQVQLALTDHDEHGFGRPYVIQRNGRFELFYSIRKKSLRQYRMGYAESEDGRHWSRKDARLNFDVTAGSFDSEAVMYAAPIEVDGQLFMFYNGNGFGRDGFAAAVLEGE